MATLNQVCIEKGKIINDIIDLSPMEAALEVDSVKYNTTLKVDEDSIYLAPALLKDAITFSGCVITESCDLPSVLEADQYTFQAGCKKCLKDLTSNEKKAFGINVSKPEPTAKFTEYYERQFIVDSIFSTRKINWLGSKDYVGADLANENLLPNYKLVDGIWTKLVAMSPAPSKFTIAKNAAATKVLQTTWTSDEVLAVVDGMYALQSVTLKTIVDTEKIVVLTTEMYDALIFAMKVKSFDLCCVGTMESQVNGGKQVQIIQYGDLKLIRYDEFSLAIKDLALDGVKWNIPNRAILMVGLPVVNYTEQGAFEEEFKAVTGNYEASYSLTTALVDPYPADFYVLGY
jgi:hypothetical protein